MRFDTDEFIKMKNELLVYEWGQRTLLTKLNIIHEDLSTFHKYNPIEYIAGRIKSPESIAEKLHRLGFDITAENAKKQLYDIAGIRIICSFARDINVLADILRNIPETNIVMIKDYVSNPKPSGYRGYHIITEVPVTFSNRTENVHVEVQLRTEAMNFWATLEHKARYKYGKAIPAHLTDELVECAEGTARLDERMFRIHEDITKL